MTYHGSTKVIPGYNIMGVAKAALKPPCATCPTTWAKRACASMP